LVFKLIIALFFGVIGLVIVNRLITDQAFENFLNILFSLGILTLIFSLFIYNTFISSILVATGGFITGSLGYYLWETEGF